VRVEGRLLGVRDSVGLEWEGRACSPTVHRRIRSRDAIRVRSREVRQVEGEVGGREEGNRSEAVAGEVGVWQAVPLVGAGKAISAGVTKGKQEE